MRAPDRRAIIAFLVVLTLLVCGRLARAARGATPPAGVRAPAGRVAAMPRLQPAGIRLEGPATLVGAPSTLHATLAFHGLRPSASGHEVAWEARLAGRPVASGLRPIAVPRGGATRLVLSLALPAIERPAGMDLRVRLRDAGTVLAEERIPFAVYPAAEAAAISDRIAAARVALYDPEGRAAPLLALLGVPHEAIEDYTTLSLYKGDLIIVGPGGFGRGREDLGPILAARARSGLGVLLLEQLTLPGTLSPDLRLWPSWSGADGGTNGGANGDANGSRILFAPDHPVLRGVPLEERLGAFDPGGRGLRPLLPPTRGNFRVIAGVRVGSGVTGQEGVRILEMGLGHGTVLAIQAPLCADGRAGARLLLINAIAHLLGNRPEPGGARLYGRSVADLPSCLAQLAPRLEPAGPGFEDAGLLVVPGDWRAARLAADAGLPPVAAVGRYLRSGGTVVLLDPQALVRPYLETIVGSAIRFDTPPASRARPAGLTFLDGIAPGDLELLGGAGRPQMLLRPSAGPAGIEPLAALPGLSAWRVGAGTLVVLILPDSCDGAPTRSLLARLFTNLGVPLDRPHSGAESVDGSGAPASPPAGVRGSEGA